MNALTPSFETLLFTEEETKKPFEATVQISTAGSTIFCNLYRGNKEIIGSMTLNLNKKGICIIGIQNFTDVKHVGQKMIQIARKISETNQFKGDLSTYATKSSHLFFHKAGFSPAGFEADNNQQLIQSEIAKSAKSGKRSDTSHLPAMLMQLKQNQ